MGSRGIEIFEEDYALDWLADLREHDDPKEFFEECLDIDDCDLELIECSGVLGTCAMIDGLLNGPKRTLPSEAKEWLQSHKSLAVKRLLKSAIRGLDAVLDDQSEACELWKENEELYPKWRRSTLALRKRLSENLTNREIRKPKVGRQPRTADSTKVIAKEATAKSSVPEFDRDSFFLPRKGSIAEKKWPDFDDRYEEYIKSNWGARIATNESASTSSSPDPFSSRGGEGELGCYAVPLSSRH
ncbi:MAG: DUF4259 domain-containing protein [Pirellula sp.]